MPETYYLEKLYPFQDRILKLVSQLNLDFYLTGGTALGRHYLNHRYSDDLDFFVNGNNDFKKQCNTAINALKNRWPCDLSATSGTFVRIFVQEPGITLKVDFVNDVPFHFGGFQESSIFHRIDSWRNILSNKLCALSRLEAKDIADIVFIAKEFTFEWETIIAEAREKDLWVEPIEICRTIGQFSIEELKRIKWIGEVNFQEFKNQMGIIHDDIFSGSPNSLQADQDGKL